jgi:hypothetical protein
MIWHRSDSRSFYSWLSASCGAFWYVLVAAPAAACSLVDPEASILASIAEARLYWIGAALLVATIFVLDFLEKRGSLDFVFGVVIAVFHPAWTVSPYFHADCTFENVIVSQWATALLIGILVLRLFRYHLRRRIASTTGPTQ